MNIGASLDRLGNSVINLSTSIYRGQENQRIEQEQEALRTQAQDNAIKLGTMRNNFTARSRAVFSEMDNMFKNYSTSQDYENSDIGGYWANQRDQLRNDLLGQYENDPQLQAQMQVELDSRLMELDQQFYNFTSERYQALKINELDNSYADLAAQGDFAGIDELTQTLLEPIGDAENQTLAGIVEELSDLYKQAEQEPGDLIQARIRQLEDQRMDIEDQIKGSRQSVYTASDILARREQALKGASLSVIQDATSTLIPQAAEDYILNGDDEYLNRFTRAERSEMAATARQNQALKMRDMSEQNTQRYYDTFNQIRTPLEAQRFRSTIASANNGVYENGQITQGYVDQGTQQQLINATDAMIDSFILQDARAAEAAQNQANAERNSQIEAQRQARISEWTTRVGTRQVGYIEALNQLDNLMREGVIDADGYRTQFNWMKSNVEFPSLKAGFDRIDALYDPERKPLENAAMRDQYQTWINSQVSQAGNGFSQVSEFTAEQTLQVVNNLQEQRQGRVIANRISMGDARNSLLNEDGRTLFGRDRKNNAEAFQELVDSNRFLGVENNNTYREIAQTIGMETLDTLNGMLQGQIRTEFSDLLAPQGTSIPPQNMIVGTGLRTQFFVPTPYDSRYVETLPDGRRGLILSTIYNPETGDNELAVKDSQGNYLPLSLSTVRSELNRGKSQFTIRSQYR